MLKAENELRTDLTVVPIEGWSRNQWFDQTGLPWTNPSPNMRSLAEATLYPGVGLLETTALSVDAAPTRRSKLSGRLISTMSGSRRR